MPFKFDYPDEGVRAWAPGGDVVVHDTDYTPTLYVGADADHDLADIREFVDGLLAVVDTGLERHRPAFRAGPEPVLRVDVDHVDRVTSVAHHVREVGPPGAFRPYNVDFSREFRYCLEEGIDPTPPAGALSSVALDATPLALADGPITELEVDEEPVDGGPVDVLEAVDAAIRETDPDVLVVSTSELIPRLHDQAAAADVDLTLGRKPGYQTLAGRSTYESYGRISHSPARFNVPGRAIADRSNSFLLSRGGMAGLRYLIERSGKPLQEAAWASIGNVLTAIQIHEARARDVLVPWNSWRHEFFKSMRQLHEADRGGYIFAPDVGFHEDVHELDFSSLYPNIICTHNVSPERIRCDCHAGRSDVPGLGYAICDEPGYLPEVLQPLIDDRDDFKEALADVDDEAERERLEGRREAIKWILVSCFGYQGFSNAKFGRIECHEAINAFAREILLDAKERLEAGGWEVVHGIVDSLWVTPRPGATPEPLDELAAEISTAAEIRLEYESAFDWLAFVPLRDGEAGALTKYFGRKTDGEYKYRGIEVRQRSTPPYVGEVQQGLIEGLDEHRTPEAVCDRLQRSLAELRAGRVPAASLVIDTKASKPLSEYTQATRGVAALERAAGHGLDKHPGQHVRYVVVDDDKAGRARVKLADEAFEPGEYDADFYADLLVRAAESVLSPLGWRRADITAYLADHREVGLPAFD